MDVNNSGFGALGFIVINYAELMCCFVNHFRVCRDGVSLPNKKVGKCSIFEQSVGSAMKDFKVYATVISASWFLKFIFIFAF